MSLKSRIFKHVGRTQKMPFWSPAWNLFWQRMPPPHSLPIYREIYSENSVSNCCCIIPRSKGPLLAEYYQILCSLDYNYHHMLLQFKTLDELTDVTASVSEPCYSDVFLWLRWSEGEWVGDTYAHCRISTSIRFVHSPACQTKANALTIDSPCRQPVRYVVWPPCTFLLME